MLFVGVVVILLGGYLVLTRTAREGTAELTRSQTAPDAAPLSTIPTGDESFTSTARARLPGAVVAGLDRNVTDAGGDLQSMAATLLNSSRPLELRRRAAWDLAKLRSPQAFAVLQQAVASAPPPVLAAIAEALGNFASPESKELLRVLLRSAHQEVARAALRAWGALGDGESVQVLSQTLLDAQKSAALRTEAALSLGKARDRRAYKALVDGLNNTGDEAIVEKVLSGLGKRRFAETETFFRSYLDRADLATDLRVAAVEALGQSDSSAVPLLLQQLRHEQGEVRAAAAWALANVDDPPNVAAELLASLERESEPEVRSRIYEALENQLDVDADKLLQTVLGDVTSSRLAGLKALAELVARFKDNSLAVEFDRVAVPQLEKWAISGEESHGRMVAVIALKESRTSAALKALERIMTQSNEPKIVAAAKMK